MIASTTTTTTTTTTTKKNPEDFALLLLLLLFMILKNFIEQFTMHSTSSLDVAPNTNTYTCTQNFKTCICAKLH